jgi:hypothetical protein
MFRTTRIAAEIIRLLCTSANAGIEARIGVSAPEIFMHPNDCRHGLT